MGLIEKYLLPKEIDFNAALMKQAQASKQSILDLENFCLENDEKARQSILTDEHDSRLLKNNNMRELLDVFITPYDKESIYRMIVQLDWISLSVKHLSIDIVAYNVKCPKHYQQIFSLLTEMVETLTSAFDFLAEKKLSQILACTQSIHDNYDETARRCAGAAAKHLAEDDIKIYLSHKEILYQLKDVSKHIHLSANALEDMAMKIV